MGKQREDCARKIAAQKTREKLIKAAEKLIKEKGFDAVQVEDITKEAGCGKGSFYTYFKKKEDIIDEIAYPRFEMVREDSKSKKRDVESRITHYLVKSIEYIEEMGLKTCQQWTKGIVDPINESGKQKFKYDKTVIEEFIQDAVNSGELDKKTYAKTLSNWIVTEYYGIVFAWALTNGETDPVKEIKDFCRGMLREYLEQRITYKKTTGIPDNLPFPVGKPNDAFAQYFIGQSYLAPLTMEKVPTFNVTFEPGCRNNWHIHHASSGGGQLLICVYGRGWYQEWGKEPRELHPGDVVNIPANVKHWHGAAKDSWFQHVAQEVPGEDGKTEWCEQVDDEQYGKLL